MINPMALTVVGRALSDALVAIGLREPPRDSTRELMDEVMAEPPTDQEWEVIVGLNALQALAHETASRAGWYQDPETGKPIKRNFGEVIALMHSELSEALEADRKGLMDDKLPAFEGRAVELADALIRIGDTAAAEGMPLGNLVVFKNRFNRRRADHRRENRVKAGGKKY